MRAVGLKVLKNKLSEYVRLAASGETISPATGQGPEAAAGLWPASIVSSRLAEYELWNRVRAYGLAGSHGAAARELLGRMAFLELAPEVLKRSLEPFPFRVRTLDALHLASFDFLQRRHRDLQLASFDDRMARAESALGFDLFEL